MQEHLSRISSGMDWRSPVPNPTTARQRQVVVPIRPQLRRNDSPYQRLPHQPQRQERLTLPLVSTPIDNCHWLLAHNPSLANLITAAIGDRWLTHSEHLQQLVPLATDPSLQSHWQAIERSHKQVLADIVKRTQGVTIDPDSLFDLHLQSICGRQRQLLNILHIITLYRQLKQQPEREIVPRTFIFSDVAAGADDELSAPLRMLISSLTELSTDPDLHGKLQVVYIPESAGLTEQMVRAADLNEQIATAATADVDLNLLKFSMSGVLSIVSMSKANHLLQQSVGADNCFSFGLAIPEITLFKERGYDPYNYYTYYPEIRQAIDTIASGFGVGDLDSCRTIVDRLLDPDEHMVLADYPFYRCCQLLVSATYRQPAVWTRMSILNVAGLG